MTYSPEPPIHSHVNVRALAAGELAAAAELLTEAFDRDPLARWLYPDTAHRRRSHREMFARILASPDTVVDVTEGVEGAAIWYPPGGYPQPEPADERDPASARELFAEIEAARPPGAFWFLAFLGARTPRGGAGSALVRNRLSLAQGPSALWTANEANLAFYSRFGYRATSRHDVPGASAHWLIRGRFEES